MNNITKESAAYPQIFNGIKNLLDLIKEFWSLGAEI